MIDLWIEYIIPSNFRLQKQIISQLREWIKDLDERGLIGGFAFNHYYSGQEEKGDLRIRFDYPEEETITVRNELQDKIRQSIPEYVAKGQSWDSKEEVLKAYESGSMCAFLLWERVGKERLQKVYFGDYPIIQNQRLIGVNSVPLNFQMHFIHGMLNSLGIPKQPNEEWLHLFALLESTGCHSPEELCKWIKSQPLQFFKFFRRGV